MVIFQRPELSTAWEKGAGSSKAQDAYKAWSTMDQLIGIWSNRLWSIILQPMLLARVCTAL